MDLSILASELGDRKTEEKKCINKACAYVKKSRLHQCDDCALLVIKERYALLGVFDGLSGEVNASLASETALKEIANYVDKNFKTKKPDQILEYAIEAANFKVMLGGTTVSVVLVLEDGNYYYANVGDSHIYKSSGSSIERITKDDRDSSSASTYFANRYVVNQCLGGIIKEIDEGSGKLNKGDTIFAISDGVVDNLFIQIEGGRVTDTSGKKDLETIMHSSKSPKEFVEMLAEEVKKRMLLKDEVVREGAVLLAKEDDASIAILTY